MDRITLVNHTGTKITLHDRLCSQNIPETPLHFRVCCPQKLIQPIRLHVINIGPEGQRCDIGSHIIPPDNLVINRLKLALSPVDLRHLLQPGELPANKPDDPAVMYSGHHVSGGIVPDRVIGRQTKI